MQFVEENMPMGGDEVRPEAEGRTKGGAVGGGDGVRGRKGSKGPQENGAEEVGGGRVGGGSAGGGVEDRGSIEVDPCGGEGVEERGRRPGPGAEQGPAGHLLGGAPRVGGRRMENGGVGGSGGAGGFGGGGGGNRGALEGGEKINFLILLIVK